MKRLLRERNRTPEWRGSAPCPGATRICLALKAFFQVTLANRKSDNWMTPLSQNSLPITRGQRLLVADQQIQHDKVELIHHLRQLQINQNEWSTLSEGREERYPMSTKKESVDDLSISRSNTSPQTAYRQIHPCYSKWWKPLPRISQWRSNSFSFGAFSLSIECNWRELWSVPRWYCFSQFPLCQSNSFYRNGYLTVFMCLPKSKRIMLQRITFLSNRLVQLRLWMSRRAI